MRTILITGATSGIGRALAEFYAGPDTRLIITGRDPDRLQEVSTLCRDKGAEMHSALIDVRARDVISPWMVDMDRRFSVDIIIANAGISGGTGAPVNSNHDTDLPIMQSGEAGKQSRDIFDVNVNGVLNTVLPLIERMKARGHGQIAIMSSLASFSAWPSAPAYSASKAAVRIYGEALRGAYQSSGVKINVVCPGFIKTPMTDVNPYPMPFMMSAEKAAAVIAKGLQKNKARIAFPWPMYFLSGFIGVLPISWTLPLLSRAPGKPARDD